MLAMIIGYCRVSSREQQVNSDALEQQKNRVKPHCDRLILDVESGSSRKRPGFKELESLIVSGRCRMVICTRIDRLTRSLSHLQRFFDLVAQHDVLVKCLDDNFDLTTATGKFHANIIGSVAEMESSMLSERVKHGWAYFRQQRKVHSPPFGYRVNAENRLELDHEPFVCLIKPREELSRYQIARRLVEWYLAPKSSLRNAVKQLNEVFGIQVLTTHKGRCPHGSLRFSTAGLGNWLDNPALLGHTAYLKTKERRRLNKNEWLLEKNTHEPLITEAEEKAIAFKLKRNCFSSYENKTERRFPASGLVRCHLCGGSCYLQSGGGSKPKKYNYYYRCHRWGSRSCDQQKMVRTEKVEAAIIDALVKQARLIAADYHDSPNKTSINPKVLELQKSLESLEKLPYNLAIEQSKTALRNEIRELKLAGDRTAIDKTDRELLLRGLSDRQFWENANPEDKAELFHYFIKNVWIDEGEVLSIDLA